jgi:hypothetical protein
LHLDHVVVHVDMISSMTEQVRHCETRHVDIAFRKEDAINQSTAKRVDQLSDGGCLQSLRSWSEPVTSASHDDAWII